MICHISISKINFIYNLYLFLSKSPVSYRFFPQVHTCMSLHQNYLKENEKMATITNICPYATDTAWKKKFTNIFAISTALIKKHTIFLLKMFIDILHKQWICSNVWPGNAVLFINISTCCVKAVKYLDNHPYTHLTQWSRGVLLICPKHSICHAMITEHAPFWKCVAGKFGFVYLRFHPLRCHSKIAWIQSVTLARCCRGNAVD